MSNNPTDDDGPNDGDAAPETPRKKKKRAKKKRKDAATRKPKFAAAAKHDSWVVRASVNLMAAGVWVGIAGLFVFGYLALTLPPIDATPLTRRPNVIILDDAGQELASFGRAGGEAQAGQST